MAKKQKQTKAKSAKPRAKREAKPKEHHPLVCTVCGYERQFVGYETRPVQTKLGPRDAKWPVYETCPNLTNPELHPARGRTWVFQEIIDQPITLQGRSGLMEGVLFQLPKNRSMEVFWAGMFSRFQERMGRDPVTLYLAEGDKADGELPVPVKSLKGLTQGYGYAYLV